MMVCGAQAVDTKPNDGVMAFGVCDFQLKPPPASAELINSKS
jgi:hypothetical protein